MKFDAVGVGILDCVEIDQRFTSLDQLALMETRGQLAGVGDRR